MQGRVAAPDSRPGTAGVVVLAALWACGALAALGCQRSTPAAPERLPAEVSAADLPELPALTTLSGLTVQAPREDAVELAFAGKVGERARYELTLRQELRQHGAHLPRATSQVLQEMHVTETVKETSPEGDTVLAAIAGVRLEFVPDDIPEAATEDATRGLEGLAYTFRRSPRGEVSGVAAVPGTGDPQAFASLARSLETSAFTLPDGPVRPGESWTRTVEIALSVTSDASVPAKVETTYELTGFADFAGTRHAVVSATVTQSFRGPLRSDDASAEIIGAAQGRGVVLFDVERGRVGRSEFAIAAHQAVLVQASEGARLLRQDHTLHLESVLSGEDGAKTDNPAASPSTR